MWGANYFPNVPLVTHRGEKVHFFDLIKDKVVAVNFIYTKCSDSCPMETARMREVAKLLGDRLGRDVFFFSISIDPANDTPERLKEYAELWHTGPGWTFLTGNDEDVTLLRKRLGVYEADLKKRDHNLSLLIGNQKTGRWMKRSPAENPYVLANQLGSWLHNWKLPSAGGRDYANAPEVRNISTGEELFRARCSSCHTVGGGDRADADERRVGPDLLGVGERRERAWLERWVMQPDAMLAEKDPIATRLFAQYNNVVMPNMRLSQADAAAVLEYIEEEGRAVAKQAAYVRASATAPGAPAQAGHADHADHAAQANHADHTDHAAQANHANHADHGAHAAPPNQGVPAAGAANQAAPAAGAANQAAPAAGAANQAAPAAGAAPLATGPLPERARGPARQSLAGYESMRAAFAADDFAGAKSHAAAIADGAMNAAADGGSAQKALVDLAASARAVGAAADVDAARLAFGELSRRVVALLAADPALREGRHLFVCPMASGYKKWVQTGPTLNNPYWGKRMLTCGSKLSDWAI